VAESYERTAVPWFTPLARHLVNAADISSGMRVLDVGTGTGLTAELAAARVGPHGSVIGIDPSMGMLALARERRGITAVRAALPGLPFPATSFDVVLANLVLSHLPDLDRGLADVRRVLRPDGRLGATAWGPGVSVDDDQGDQADSIVASVREACGLTSEAPVKGAPWEEFLRSKAQLSGALTGAGFGNVDARLITNRVTFTVENYLVGWGGLGRYLRWHAGMERWHDFTDRAAAALRARFGPSIVVVKQMWVVTSARPQGRE
jgi:SAM-dependent methyltransferase